MLKLVISIGMLLCIAIGKVYSQSLVWESTIDPGQYGFEYLWGDALGVSGEGYMLISATTSNEQPTVIELGQSGEVLRYSSRPVLSEEQLGVKNSDNITYIEDMGNKYEIRMVEKETILNFSQDYGFHAQYLDGASGLSQSILNGNEEDSMLNISCGTNSGENGSVFASYIGGSNSHLLLYKVNNFGVLERSFDIDGYSSPPSFVAKKIAKLNNSYYLLSSNANNIVPEGTEAFELVKFDSQLNVTKRILFSPKELGIEGHIATCMNMDVQGGNIYITGIITQNQGEHYPVVFVLNTNIEYEETYILKQGNFVRDISVDNGLIAIVGNSTETATSILYTALIHETSGQLMEFNWAPNENENQLMSCQLYKGELYTSGRSGNSLYAAKLSLPASIEEVSDSEEVSIWPNITDGVSEIRYSESEPESYTVTNTLGQTVMTVSDIYSFDSRNLVSGSYYLSFEIGGKKVVKKVIVK